MAEMAEALAAFQHDDGLFDQGNLHSTPDSSFTLQDLCQILTLLDQDDDARTKELRATITGIVRKAGPALATGGVHTPNHRWEMSRRPRPDQRALPRPPLRATHRRTGCRRASTSTRTGSTASAAPTTQPLVTNPSLLAIARLADKPELYANVRANLQAALYQVEPNGEVEVVQSRRQDQTTVRSIAGYWLHYRELALRDRDGRFAAMARDIQQRYAAMPVAEDPPGDGLAHVLENPSLARPLPASASLPTRFTHHDPDTGTVRLRYGDDTATIFGGTDFAETSAIASGLSTNPTFFKAQPAGRSGLRPAVAAVLLPGALPGR